MMQVVLFWKSQNYQLHHSLQSCVDTDSTEIVIMPYFLSEGKYIAEDIQMQVNIERNEYPQVKIIITDYVGKHNGYD